MLCTPVSHTTHCQLALHACGNAHCYTLSSAQPFDAKYTQCQKFKYYCLRNKIYIEPKKKTAVSNCFHYIIPRDLTCLSLIFGKGMPI